MQQKLARENIGRAKPIAVKNERRVPRPAAWSVIVLLFLLVIGFGRLYWSARSGSEEFATSIRMLAGATVGAVIDLRTPAESHPNVQLEFWQSEIDRILDAHPADAELHAAAAVMLAEPSSLYSSQLIREVAAGADSDRWSVSSNFLERLHEARSRFDKKGAKRSTELMRRATELDPDDPRWWRLRAVLLWPSRLSSRDRQPLDPSWEQVLNVAKQHDPGNALYSLLQAHWAIEQAVDFDEDMDFVIEDLDAWRQAIEHVRQSVASPHLTLGEPAMNGVVRLHELSQHPLPTTTESVRARFVASRAVHPSALLIRNLMRIAGARKLSDKDEARAELLSLAQEVCELALERSDKVLRYDAMLVQLRMMVWQAIEDLERQRGEVSQATTDELKDAVQWQTAFQTAANEFQRRGTSSAGAVNAVASATVLSLFAASLAVALLSFAVWLVCSRSPASLRLRYWPFVLFAVGTALSVLFLGAGSARLVPETVQYWVFTGFSFAVLLSLLSGIAVRSRLRFRFPVHTLVAGCAAAAAVLQAVLHFGLGGAAGILPLLANTAPDPLLNIAHQRAPGFLDQWLPGPQWVSLLMLQWLTHDGPAWGVVMFFGFAFIALVWCKSVPRCSGQLLVASVVLAMLWLNAWVWIEPANYASARPTQMRHESYIRSIDEYYEPFEELLERALREE